MLRSNPSAAAGGCTAVEAVSILRGSGRPLILPVAQKAKNLRVWGRASEAAESGNTFLFRHLKSLIVAEPRHLRPHYNLSFAVRVDFKVLYNISKSCSLIGNPALLIARR